MVKSADTVKKTSNTSLFRDLRSMNLAFYATGGFTGMWGRFRALGCHFVPCGGKNAMSRPLAIATGLEIPVFAIFDADGRCINTDEEESNRRDNRCLLRLLGHGGQEEYPSKAAWFDNALMWPDRIHKSIRESIGSRAWDEAEEKVRSTQGLRSGVKRKNPLLIVGTLEELWRSDSKCDVLRQACKSILSFAESFQRSDEE